MMKGSISRKPVLFSMLTLGILFCIVLCAGCLKESTLQVRDITIAAERVGPATAVFNVTTLVENIYGFPQAPVSVVLKVYDGQTNLLVHSETSEIGTIVKSGTRSVSQLVQLQKRGSFRFDVTVFEGDALKATGSYTIAGLERLPADSEGDGIEIRDMDFLVKEVTGGQAVVDVGIYFTNTGDEPSRPYDVEIRAREKDARLTADRSWARLEEIPPESTVISYTTITIPDQYNYEVDVMLWRNGTIVKEGQGLVQLHPGTAVSNGKQFTTRTIDTGVFVTKTPSDYRSMEVIPYPQATRTPGFGLLAILAVLAGGVLVLPRRR